MNKPIAISKILSPNDLGETGSHQAGICVPKKTEILSFFPDLGNEEKNPRATMYFKDNFGKTLKTNFIYYNNKFFDEKGTRNEYRLTGLTGYFHENALKAGDEIILSHRVDGTDFIEYRRNITPEVKMMEDSEGHLRKRLVINAEWKVIDW